MIVKVFRGISKDFAELTKTAQMEKTADYTGIVFCFFFVVSQLNYFVLKVVDLEPFNDTWRKKRSVGNYRHRRNLIGNV
jgi:penicillin-binding protein-related factor A (putative recombinase)